ncbi:MAG: peptidase M28, partial [Gammaproteobacteria bacterium]|nr:peptidase M28 [Gammaproteobacteria bacterium]
MRVLIAIAGLACCGAAPATGALHENPGLQERLRAHVGFLADDLLRGRQPGTEGYDIAARYVVSQFRQLGLEPAGADGGYLQPVPLRRAWQEPDSARLSVRRGWGEHKLKFAEQFFMRPSRAHAESHLAADMVFVGYGIDAPELEYNDYEHVDVEGKVAVFIGGQPHDFPSEEGAHFASGREKLNAALRHGAIGIVSIYTPRNEKRYQWDRVHSLVGQPSMGWLTVEGEVFAAPPRILGEATVHFSAAEVFFEGAGHSLADILAMDEQAEPVPAFELTGQVNMAQRSRHEAISSPNVAAFLPGADPLLSDEFVVYTAHLDHIGELHGEGHQDAINNGALDN